MSDEPPVTARVRSDDGTTIVFDTYAGPEPTAPPVVLLTAAGADRTDFAALARAVSRTRTAVAYDRRARGDSDDRSADVGAAVDRELEDLRALLDAVGGEATLLGYSSGAVLAAVAAARGLPVEAVVLCEPPFTGADDSVDADLPDRLAGLAATGHRGDAVALFMTQGVGLGEEAVAQARQAPFWPRMEAMASSFAYDAAITCRYPDAAALAGQVRVPTLVLAGRDTWPDLARAARHAAEALGGELRVVEGADHALVPEAVAGALTDFLARVRAAPDA